jgi:hypothetical protein
MSEQDRTPRPNQILAQPATVQACASDLRTPGQQAVAAGAARTQLAETRMNAAGGRS